MSLPFKFIVVTTTLNTFSTTITSCTLSPLLSRILAVVSGLLAALHAELVWRVALYDVSAFLPLPTTLSLFETAQASSKVVVLVSAVCRPLVAYLCVTLASS